MGLTNVSGGLHSSSSFLSMTRDRFGRSPDLYSTWETDTHTPLMETWKTRLSTLIVQIPLCSCFSRVVNTSERLCHDFLRFLFLYTHGEVRTLDRNYLRSLISFVFFTLPTWLTVQGSVSLDSKFGNEGLHSLGPPTQPFIPFPRFIHSRWSPPLSTLLPSYYSHCLQRYLLSFMFVSRGEGVKEGDWGCRYS